MRNLARIVVFGLVLCVTPRISSAAIIPLADVTSFGDFSFASGPGLFDELTRDDDVLALTISLLSADFILTAETTSFRSGGFDPYVALFDSAGTIVQFDDPADGLRDAFHDDIDPDPATPNWDARLQLALTAGTYTLVLAQYANNYLDGQMVFEAEGIPDYTLGFAADPGNCTGFLVAIFDECRTGAFALNVSLVSLAAPPPPPAPVPEPATLTLFGIGAAGAALRKALRRRRTPSSH